MSGTRTPLCGYSSRKRGALAIKFALQTCPATALRAGRFSLPIGQSKMASPLRQEQMDVPTGRRFAAIRHASAARLLSSLLCKLALLPPCGRAGSLCPSGKAKWRHPHDGGQRHFGLPDRIRTCGLKSRSLALYPAGLRVGMSRISVQCCGWWTRRDSNPRPPRCERGALPTELRARQTFCNVPIIAQSFSVCKGLCKNFCRWKNAFCARPNRPRPPTFCGFFEKGLDKRSRVCYNGTCSKKTQRHRQAVRQRTLTPSFPRFES